MFKKIKDFLSLVGSMIIAPFVVDFGPPDADDAGSKPCDDRRDAEES